MNPLISVIMPVYNVEKYIQNSISSVLNQNYENLELIVVIDGSPDKSADIAEEYAKEDKRVQVVYKKNGGLSDARNYGIDIARGKYIYFIDSDDYIDKNLLENVVFYAESNNLDVTVFGFYAEYENLDRTISYTKKIVPPRGIYTKDKLNEFKIDEEFYNYIGYAWNKLYKASIIKTQSKYFIKGLSLIEDIEFNYSILKDIHKIGFMDEALYHYMQRPRITLVNSKYDNLYDLKLRAAKLRIEILKDWNIEEDCLNRHISKLYLSALNSGLANISTCDNLSIKSKKLEIKRVLDINKELNYKLNSHNKISLREKILIVLVNMKLYNFIILKYNLIAKLRK